MQRLKPRYLINSNLLHYTQTESELKYYCIIIDSDFLSQNEIFTELHVENDIGMYYCGRRVGTNNHEYGPEIRNHYIFVLVNKGSAVLLKEQEITFASHDLLVMHPNEKIHYKALEPWSITWLGLYGDAVEELVKKRGTFLLSTDVSISRRAICRCYITFLREDR